MAGDAVEPSAETVAAEEHEVSAAHTADRPPSPEEEELADRAAKELGIDPAGVRRHYREMTKTGAMVEGEGHIE